MWASLNAAFREEPRWPDVPNATRYAGSRGSGRTSRYALTSRSRSTSCAGSAGRPACVLIAIESSRTIVPQRSIEQGTPAVSRRSAGLLEWCCELRVVQVEVEAALREQ